MLTYMTLNNRNGIFKILFEKTVFSKTKKN